MSIHCVRLVVAFCLFLPTLASAACQDQSALRAAISSGYEANPLSLIACKAMPEKPRFTIVAFINEIGNHSYTMTVLLVSKATGEIRYRFVDEDPSFGPNGDPSHIAIDTGQYWLASNMRAFGVNVKHSLNAWDRTEDLNLFIPTTNALLRVVKDLRVASSSMRECMESHQMKRVISVAKSSSHGLYDLLVKTTRTDYEPMMTNDSCTSQEVTRSNTIKLQYTGDYYAYPSDFY